MQNLESTKLFLSDYLVDNGIPCRQTSDKIIIIEKFAILCGADMALAKPEMEKLTGFERGLALARIKERITTTGEFKLIDLFYSIHMKRPEKAKKKKASTKFTRKDNQWLELRYQALKTGGGSCCLCGMTAKDGIKLHVDHIKPKSLFPELEYTLDNLQILCDKCNIGKSNKDDTDWR